jgi:hypothetical protein
MKIRIFYTFCLEVEIGLARAERDLVQILLQCSMVFLAMKNLNKILKNVLNGVQENKHH